MDDIKIVEFELVNGKGAVFAYVGNGDPVRPLDKAIYQYTGGIKHIHLVDANMNNPWVRVVLSDIDEIQTGGTDFNEILRDVRLNHLLNLK